MSKLAPTCAFPSAQSTIRVWNDSGLFKGVQFVFKGMIATLVYTGLHKLLTKYLVFITIIAQAKVKKKKDWVHLNLI